MIKKIKSFFDKIDCFLSKYTKETLEMFFYGLSFVILLGGLIFTYTFFTFNGNAPLWVIGFSMLSLFIGCKFAPEVEISKEEKEVPQ